MSRYQRRDWAYLEIISEKEAITRALDHETKKLQEGLKEGLRWGDGRWSSGRGQCPAADLWGQVGRGR